MKRLLTVFILAVMLCAMAAGAAAQEGIPYTVSYYVPTLRPVIDRRSPVRVIDTRGSGATPFNGSKLPSIGLGLEEDDQDNYRVKSADNSTKVFKDQICYYPAQPGLSYINEISGVFMESETYLLSRVVIKDDLGKVVSQFDGEDTIRSIVFTNNQQAAADGRTVIIREDGSTHIELHYTAKENAFRVPADFYDYDISDGKVYDSNWNEIGDRNADTIYANTTEQGINSPDEDEWKERGAKLAFGNSNTKSGLHDQTWNGQTFNVYNSNNPGEHSGTTYGITVNNALRTDADGKKLPVFQSGIAYKEWFGPEAATGKTQIDGFELGFSNVGDTYTLKWVYHGDEAVISNLDSFRKRDFYDSNDEYVKSIYSNDFWPMDHAGTYNQNGHDIKFGNTYNYDHEKRLGGQKGSSDVTALPPGDDGLDHNSYFGMRFSLQFELDPDYMGPMEYVFFGDDDM